MGSMYIREVVARLSLLPCMLLAGPAGRVLHLACQDCCWGQRAQLGSVGDGARNADVSVVGGTESDTSTEDLGVVASHQQPPEPDLPKHRTPEGQSCAEMGEGLVLTITGEVGLEHLVVCGRELGRVQDGEYFNDFIMDMGGR